MAAATTMCRLGDPLGLGADMGATTVALSREQAHYLFGVMRQAIGSELLVFNGQDGEWRAVVTYAKKRGGQIRAEEQTRPQSAPPDLWLLFAPIKKTRTDFIVEKAVELGVRRICPVQTQFTNSDRIRQDRLQAHAIEAAEQCGATFVPEVAELEKLAAVLSEWDAKRQLVFCDEALNGQSVGFDGVAQVSAIVIGPEGGFSGAERARLREHPNSRSVSLGPRILRADTAAVAAITLWQSAVGDWR